MQRVIIKTSQKQVCWQIRGKSWVPKIDIRETLPKNPL
jgi:hypothetical protein